MVNHDSLVNRQHPFWVLFVSVLAALIALASFASPLLAQDAAPDSITWYTVDDQGEVKVDLYFFWSSTCPHCREAHPFITALPDKYPWLNLHALELSENPGNSQLYAAMASSLGQEAMYVPAFFFCGYMTTGYDTAETSGAALVENLHTCRDLVLERIAEQSVTGPATAPTSTEGITATEAVTGVAAVPAAGAADPEAAATGDEAASAAAGLALAAGDAEMPNVTLPLIGALNVQQMSLPLFTGVLAGLDAFNPCAFFVLLFLLSLMVHARNRRRMMLIGAVFVFFSGLIYFVFMAAWLNIFLWVGELKLITLIAGLVAVVIALINIKDFFWFKQGVSLSIPESAKPGLYQRMRNLVRAGSMPAMLASTAVLAIAANSYELLCTSGFPMVYTRVLTLSDLAPSVYYLYLAVYNVIYVLPLLLIVVVFTLRFGAHKLTENEGRTLKLLSGLMMLLLGGILVVAPDLLNQVWTAIGLLAAAVVITAVIVVIDRRSRRHPPRSLSGSLRPH